MLQASRLSDDIMYLRDGRISGHEENILSGHIGTDSEGTTVCTIRDSVAIPVRTDKTGRVRISVDPGSVSITGSERDGGRGDLIKGRLVQLTDEKGCVRALVDIGVPLGVLVSKKQIRASHMEIGGNVFISIAPDGVTVL